VDHSDPPAPLSDEIFSPRPAFAPQLAAPITYKSLEADAMGAQNPQGELLNHLNVAIVFSDNP
jgi:hypothetical protein